MKSNMDDQNATKHQKKLIHKIERIEYYLETRLMPLGLKVLGHTERLMGLFYNQIITALMENRFEHPESVVGRLRDDIVPFKI